MTAVNRENKVLGALIVTGVIAVAASGSAGTAPVFEGDPGDAAHLARDHDGIACESGYAT